MPSPEEISNLCRLCLEKRQVNVLIFEEHARTRNTFMKISSCLPVKVSKSDELPKKICEVCCGKLDSFYEFWKQSSESEKQLQDWLKQPPPEPAPDPMPVLKQEEVDYKAIGYNNSDSAPSTSILSTILQTQVSDEPPSKKPKFVTEPDTILHTFESDEEIEAKIEDNSNDSNSNGDAEGLDYGDDGQVNPDNPDDQPGPSGVGKSSDETPCPRRSGTNIKEKSRLKGKTVDKVREVAANRCNVCGKLFKRKQQLRYHEARHNKTYKIECECCGKGFYRTSDYKIHNNVHHLGVRFTCAHCDRFFTDKKYYGRHLMTHSESYVRQVHSCGECGNVYKSRNGFLVHVKRHHQKQQFVCDVCGKTVVSKGSLKQHLMIHAGEKPFVCNYCGKRFNKMELLQVHTRVHTKERPYCCDGCGKSFTQKSALSVHMRYHKAEKPFTCCICEKQFVTKTLLKNHITMHGK